MLFEEQDWKDDENAKELENCLIEKVQRIDSLNNREYIGNEANAPIEPTKKKRRRKRKSADLSEKQQTQKKHAGKADDKISAVKEQVNINNTSVQCQSTDSSNDKQSEKTDKGKLSKSNWKKEQVNINTTSVQCQSTDSSNDKQSEKTDKGKLSKSNWKRHKLSQMFERKTPISTKPSEKDNSSKKNFALQTEKQDSENSKSRSDNLRLAVTTKLQSAQFRFINEQLYSRCSKDAKKLFTSDSNSFKAYHTGFNQQVAKWPVNPLDTIINFIKKRPSRWVIGDFGCGDARLAASVKNQVHSFDLVSVNERVTVADISHVPLADGSLDVAVFCLSLMGTNYIDFIKEANRTLKSRGLLKIAEVASRFSSVRKFIMLMKKLGFDVDRRDDKDTHFIMFDFRKVKSYQRDVVSPIGLLKPCVYKKR